MTTQLTLRALLDAGVHFGHQTRFWNPKMAPYIYGQRNRIHIINLERTLPMLESAMRVLKQVAQKRGTVLMLGSKRQAREIVAREATRAGMPYVCTRWLGGMLTNFKTIKASIKKLKDMEAYAETNLAQMGKKEALTYQREIDKLKRVFDGFRDMERLPDALFVIDVGYHKIAMAEAKKLGIPIIGVVDSNYSPDGIDHVIPGNDDSTKAIALYAAAAADAVIAGRNEADARTLAEVRGEGAEEFVEVTDDAEAGAGE